MKDYKLFLDDIREPVTDDWVIARTYAEAVNVIKTNGIPKEISFDHDLGPDQETGYDLAKYIVCFDQDHDQIDDTFVFNVHSANPVGAENIRQLLQNYINFKNANRPV